jgi:cytochrome c-type biogenesis protein CcmH/NrfG
MANEASEGSAASPSLPSSEAYGMAIICLLIGLVIGYLIPAWPSALTATHAASSVAPAVVAPRPAVSMSSGHIPTLDEMKHMADKQAQPLLDKLKSDPKSSDVLAQLGAIYHMTHQFKLAADYYNKAVELDPKNVALRNKLASSLYRDGDVDSAIAQLNQALIYDPKDANSLFNLGMIRMQGKKDGKGALAAWQRLLKSNPQLSADRKAQVQKLMADVLTGMGSQYALEGARSNDGRKPTAN